MNIQTLTIKKTRDNLAEIIDRASMKGERFIITKFGKKKAMIVPLENKKVKKDKKAEAILKKSFGMWKDKWSKTQLSVDIADRIREKQYRNV